jgi:TusA-related sulfurtransferase
MTAEKKQTLDITRDVCPMTWVKTKLALEDLAADEELCVVVREGESSKNVSANSQREGHEIVKTEARNEEENIVEIIIKKCGGNP